MIKSIEVVSILKMFQSIVVIVLRRTYDDKITYCSSLDKNKKINFEYSTFAAVIFITISTIFLKMSISDRNVLVGVVLLLSLAGQFLLGVIHLFFFADSSFRLSNCDYEVKIFNGLISFNTVLVFIVFFLCVLFLIIFKLYLFFYHFCCFLKVHVLNNNIKKFYVFYGFSWCMVNLFLMILNRKNTFLYYLSVILLIVSLVTSILYALDKSYYFSYISGWVIVILIISIKINSNEDLDTLSIHSVLFLAPILLKITERIIIKYNVKDDSDVESNTTYSISSIPPAICASGQVVYKKMKKNIIE